MNSLIDYEAAPVAKKFQESWNLVTFIAVLRLNSSILMQIFNLRKLREYLVPLFVRFR